MMTCSVTEYQDPKPNYDKLDRMLSLPPTAIKKGAMKNYLEYFNTQCTRSEEIVTEAQNYIPGGVQHNLAFNYPFTLVFEKAEGAYLYDIDGNCYVDFVQAGGATVLGGNHPEVRKQVITPSGIEYGTMTHKDIVEVGLKDGSYTRGKPSSERNLHIEIYNTRKGIHGIVQFVNISLRGAHTTPLQPEGSLSANSTKYHPTNF